MQQSPRDEINWQLLLLQFIHVMKQLLFDICIIYNYII